MGQLALALLATPLNLMVLRALADRPMRLTELRRATGLPAQTTLRGHLANLADLGMLNKRPNSHGPHAIENELTPMGGELLGVAARLEVWLKQCAEGPIALESATARGVVKAFADGWGSGVMAALATRPMSLTELDQEIGALSYPALERRLSSMRMAGLVEARPAGANGTPYAVTEWARKGVAPLASAARCEQVHMPDRAAPVRQADIEAAFMLAVPLVGLPPDAGGSCRLGVEPEASGLRERAGVQVTVERGRVVACRSGAGPQVDTFAVGSPALWYAAIKDGTAQLLRIGGGGQLAESLVTGLHLVLVRG